MSVKTKFKMHRFDGVKIASGAFYNPSVAND